MLARRPPPPGEEGTGEWILAVQATGKLITKGEEELFTKMKKKPLLKS